MKLLELEDLKSLQMAKLEETVGICPICKNMCNQEITEEKNKIFLRKDCCEQSSWLLENDAEFYKKYFLPFKCYISEPIEKGEFYLDAYLKKIKTSACPNLYITSRCNMNCPICFVKDYDKIPDITMEDLEILLKLYKGKTLALSGGEPTEHPQFFEILKLFKKHKKNAWILTNGLNFSDYKFCIKIKKIGIGRICISFDGWNRNIYYDYRNQDVLNKKLKALQNLKELNIPTNLFVVIGKENLHELEDIIYLAASKKNKFIKDLWLINKYPSDEIRSSDIAKEICKVYNIPIEYFYELKRLKWNIFNVLLRFKINKEYVDTDMLYDIMFFKILNPSIDMAWPLDYLSSTNAKIEGILNDKSPLFYIKCLKFIPDAARLGLAKFNHKFRRKYLAITLSKILSPKNIDFLRDNNIGLDPVVVQYKKNPSIKDTIKNKLPLNSIMGD